MNIAWICADHSGHRETIEAETAQQAAEEYVATGDWPTEHRTTWHHITVWPADDEDASPARIRVVVEPLVPPCVEAEHDFRAPLQIVGGIRENPGVWGRGGGIVAHEVCLRCGCGRTTDTWAQDPENGEQGLYAEQYEPNRYVEDIAA